MTDSRERVLADIRSALGRKRPLSDCVTQALADRLRSHPAGPLPHFEGDLLERFLAKARACEARAEQVGDALAASKAVVAAMAAADMGDRIVVSDEPEISAMPWSNRLTVETGRAARHEDKVSVTGAFAGIAETGTLFLRSSEATPTSLNFLPEMHIVILRRHRLVRHLEDAWDLHRRECGSLPRTVNLITGPSKTADVEQTIQLGAHGPRHLHIIVVDEF